MAYNAQSAPLPVPPQTW